MKNKNSCSADVHERVDKGFGPLNENLGRSLMCVVMILGFIFGLSGGVSAYTPLGGGVCNCGDGNALDLTFTFNRAIPSPDSNVFALGFGDDGFLWVHSQESKIIYKLDPVTGSAIQSFPSGITTSLSDIDVREGILYGGGEPTIFRYDTSSGEPLSSLTGPVVGGSRGLTFVGADLYVSGVLDGLPWVQLGRVDPLTGSLLGSSAPPDLVYSYGIGAIGQNVGYLVNPLFEYGDVTLYIVDPLPRVI